MMEILKAYEEAPEQYFGQRDEEYFFFFSLLLFLSTFQ